ncbi:hypothetical protein ACRRTK_003370 [Alexandromys fortis]
METFCFTSAFMMCILPWLLSLEIKYYCIYEENGTFMCRKVDGIKATKQKA